MTLVLSEAGVIRFGDNGFVIFSDPSLFKQRFTSFDPDANFDGVGLINFSDLAIFKSLFGKPPGPSGVVP